MLNINDQIELDHLEDDIIHFWTISGEKIKLIEKEYDKNLGSPVFTSGGKYTSRGWTEWTQGFLYGSMILQFDGTGDDYFLELGKKATLQNMAGHLTHMGVHDHGFNNISTYGNLLRLMRENKISYNRWEEEFYKLAIKVSGAVQASRWTETEDGGFIYSFNGPHSLFVDTIRSCRVLFMAHLLGHILYAENEKKISLLDRAIKHLLSTVKYSVFYGNGRDLYDQMGRTAHECIFNVKNGLFRCVNTQQGYSGFSTWTRGLAWAILGLAEELEIIQQIPELMEDSQIKSALVKKLEKAASATAGFYIRYSPLDGIPYWDTGAPGLSKMGNYLEKPADPFNNFEPVDSSAAVIAAQGLLRLGKYFGINKEGKKYFQAGLTISKVLLDRPYLSTNPEHQGLILHSVYHRPNHWDFVGENATIPYGESSMWGDYHARELVLYLNRLIRKEPYYTYFRGFEK